MLTYVIVVNDNGELKTITEAEIDEMDFDLDQGYTVEAMINETLDARNNDNASVQIRQHINGLPFDLPPGTYEAELGEVNAHVEGGKYVLDMNMKFVEPREKK